MWFGKCTGANDGKCDQSTSSLFSRVGTTQTKSNEECWPKMCIELLPNQNKEEIFIGNEKRSQKPIYCLARWHEFGHFTFYRVLQRYLRNIATRNTAVASQWDYGTGSSKGYKQKLIYQLLFHNRSNNSGRWAIIWSYLADVDNHSIIACTSIWLDRAKLKRQMKQMIRALRRCLFDVYPRFISCIR